MTTPYHRRVQEHVLSFGQRNPEKFPRVHNDKRPVHIVHPMKIKSFLYYPDVRFETRSGKNYIFEVMDTEVGKQALIVAHVVQAVFTPHVLKVFFIVRKERDLKNVNRITDVVLGNLEDLGVRRLNKRVRFVYVVISPEDSKDFNRVAEALAETRELPAQPGFRSPTAICFTSSP